jgi:hypothetical protein
MGIVVGLIVSEVKKLRLYLGIFVKRATGFKLSYGWIQHYVIKFVSVLRQVGGFRRVFRFPLQKKLTATI